MDAILTMIDGGALNPGDVIAENALRARLDILRMPLREAPLQLQAQKLVTRQPRKGVVVFKPTLEEFPAVLEMHASLDAQGAGLAAQRLSFIAEALLNRQSNLAGELMTRHVHIDQVTAMDLLASFD